MKKLFPHLKKQGKLPFAKPNNLSKKSQAMPLLKISMILASVFAGSMIAFQAPINHKLGSFMGGPLVAAFCSFAVGTVILGLLVVLTGNTPRPEQFTRPEIWMWAGGLLGSIFVFTSITAVPILGSALMLSLFIMGQLMGALIIDKTGFLLPMQIEIGWERILALFLILGGVVLFARGT